jgi:DNA-binding PadR family transcriptional regulator
MKCLVDFIVLQQLSEHSMHGYEILTQIRKRLGIYFGPSTIYPLLVTFHEKGYVTSNWDVSGCRPRKVYRITMEGRNLLSIYEESINLMQTKNKHQLTAEPEVTSPIPVLELNTLT